MQQKISNTHRLVIMALLMALSIILSRFLSISAWDLKIGFAFAPIALAGMLLGPIPAGITAAGADFLGATLFPIGQFFPGFTLTAFLTGLLFGAFLHKKANTKNIVLASISTQIIGSLLLNTLWISMLYGTPFWALMPTRILQTCVMTVIQIIVIRILAGYAPQILKNAKSVS
ncbi:Folate transporter FolT [anaerobic digester metagenome]